MELDKTVLLIYYWLKEHRLLRTCACLEKEYGKTILEQEKPPIALRTILQALATLIYSLSNSEETLSTFMTSVNTLAEHMSPAAMSPTASNGDLVESPKPKKKIKTPFFPVGQWVCPEMESTLLKVYERTMLSIEADKVLDKYVPPECISETQSEKNDTTTTKSIEIIENVQPEIRKGDLNMFTSDSDSDSGDDFPKSSTISNITNGVLNLVAGTLEKKESEIRSLTTDAVVGEGGKNEDNEDDTATKSIVNNSTNNTKGVIDVPEIQVKKKKKKKRVLMPNALQIYDGEPDAVGEKKLNFVDIDIDEENVVEKQSKIISSEEREGKKKKRKNKVPLGEENTSEKYPDAVSSEVREVKKKKKKTDSEDIPSSVSIVEKSPEDEAGEQKEIKKKKKKMKTSNSIDDIHNTINTNANNQEQNVTEATPSPSKKKKKKSEREGTENTVTGDIHNTINTNANNTEQNIIESTPIKKKKKKWESEGKENELTPRVENKVKTKTKEENNTNSQDENKLALNSLCNSLKKKKKKKNVAFGQ